MSRAEGLKWRWRYITDPCAASECLGVGTKFNGVGANAGTRRADSWANRRGIGPQIGGQVGGFTTNCRRSGVPQVSNGRCCQWRLTPPAAINVGDRRHARGERHHGVSTGPLSLPHILRLHLEPYRLAVSGNPAPVAMQLALRHPSPLGNPAASRANVDATDTTISLHSMRERTIVDALANAHCYCGPTEGGEIVV